MISYINTKEQWAELARQSRILCPPDLYERYSQRCLAAGREPKPIDKVSIGLLLREEKQLAAEC